MGTYTHTMQSIRRWERIAFEAIPGIKEILTSSPSEKDAIAQQFPDAAFALMIADNILGRDREQCAINQSAYFSILNGENMADIRFRYDTEMRKYVERRMWDD